MIKTKLTTLLQGRDMHHGLNQVVFIEPTLNTLVRTCYGGGGDFQLQSVVCRNKQKEEDHTEHVDVKLR